MDFDLQLLLDAPDNSLSNFLSDNSLLDKLLDRFPYYPKEVQENASKLLEKIGKNSINGTQLKKIFRLLQSRGKTRPYYTSFLLRSLKAMLMDLKEPRNFFLLEGNQSGLVLPPIKKWPASKSFSFTVWFKVDTEKLGSLNDAGRYSSNDNSRVYTPCILSLRTEKRGGFEVFLSYTLDNPDKLKLIIKSYNANGECASISPQSIMVQTKKWHFLGLSIYSISTLKNKYEIALLLDEKYTRLNFSFPCFNCPIHRPLIGNCTPFPDEADTYSVFKGQIGTVHIFSESISEGQLRGIYALGPNYLYCFEPTSWSAPDYCEQHFVDPSTSILSGDLMSKVMLSFNSVGWDGKGVVDNTPRQNSIRWIDVNNDISDISTQIFLMENTHRIERSDFRTALEALGGIKIILPLFMQLGQPVLDSDGNVSMESDVDLSISILELVKEILKSAPESAFNYMKSSGFLLISYFLERISKVHLTITFSEALINLYPQNSPNVSFQECLIEHVLFNFNMITQGSLEFQLNHLEKSNFLVAENPTKIRRLIGIPKLFTALYNYYEYKFDNSSTPPTPENSIENSENLFSSDNLLIKRIRLILFDIIRRVLSDGCGPYPEEITESVIYILKARSALSKCDGISLLSEVVYNPISDNTFSNFLLGLACDSNFLALLNIYQSKHLNVKTQLFILCCHIIQLTVEVPILPNIPEGSLYFNRTEYSAMSGTSSLMALGLNIAQLPSLYISWVKSILEASELSSKEVEIYNQAISSTLQLTLYGEPCYRIGKFLNKIHWQFLENKTSDRISESISKEIPSYEKFRSLMDAVIVNPMIFPALLIFCKSLHSNDNIRLTTIVNIRAAISSKAENADQIIRIPHWQNHILNFLVNELELKKQYEIESNKSKGIIDSCIRLLCDLLITAIKIGLPIEIPILRRQNEINSEILTAESVYTDISKGLRQIGTTALRESMSYLRIYAESGKLNAQEFGFEILYQVVLSMKQSIEHLHNKNLSDNVIQTYGIKILHLNIWLAASITLDFITAPILQGITSNNIQTSFGQSPLSKNEIELNSELTLLYDNSKYSEFLKYYKTFIPKFGTNSLSAWKVIDTLLTILEPLETSSDWIMKEQTFRRQVRQHFGVFTSRKMLAHVHEDVDELVSTTMSSPSKVNSKAKTNNIISKSMPSIEAAESVNWVIIRFLTSYLENGLETLDYITPEDCRLLSTLAQKRLEPILNTFKSKFIEYHNFECINIIARLYFIFQSSNLNKESIWAKLAFELFLTLISEQRENINSLLTLHKKGMNLYHLISLFPQRASVSMEMISGYDSSSIIITYVQKVLESQINEEDWSRVMLEVLEEAQSTEGESIRARTNDMGLHKHSQRLKAQLVEFISNYKRQMSNLQLQINSSANNLKYLDDVHQKDFIKSEELKLKKTLSILASSLDEHIVLFSRETSNQTQTYISNSNEEFESWSIEKTVFWLFDSFEANNKVRFRLIRNLNGTQHRIASNLCLGSESSITKSDDSNISNVRRNSVDFQFHHPLDNSGNELSSGWWKDLVKYRKSNELPTQYDEDDENIDQTDFQTNDNKSETSFFSESDLSSARSQKISENNHTVSNRSFFYNMTSKFHRNLFTAPVEMITCATNSSGGKTHGNLEVTKYTLKFIPKIENSTFNCKNPEIIWVTKKYPASTWLMSDIIDIFQRSYQFRFLAVEIVFQSKKSIFISLPDEKIARELFFTIRKYMTNSNCTPYFGRRPNILIQKFTLPIFSPNNLTSAWIKRKITNFDYIMHLNNISGRSYNDLSQYPIFPWVIADYTSKKLDLKNPMTFRDFRWPMGAQNPSQREALKAKYSELEECFNPLDLEDTGLGLPPFHHGSHYNTMGFVLWYLLRLEPYTSMHVWLQDGKFDKADRLFDSIAKTWHGCISNPSDVKELIPEFFTCPEMFLNINKIDLGKTQLCCDINDVKLPPWADNAFDFVTKHREALESEYVSQNLHHWIDLIWGYKQRPPHLGGTSNAAVDACNVFYYLTYSGSVDLKTLKETDPSLYEKMSTQIDNFGQIPTQLFETPHPSRLPVNKMNVNFWPICSTPNELLGLHTVPNGTYIPPRPKSVVGFSSYSISSKPILFLACSPMKDKVISIDSLQRLGIHGWQSLKPDIAVPFIFETDEQISQNSVFPLVKFIRSYGSTTKIRQIGVPYAYQKLAFKNSSISQYITIQKQSVYSKHEKTRLRVNYRPRNPSTDMTETPNIRPNISSSDLDTSLTMSDNSFSDVNDSKYSPPRKSKAMSEDTISTQGSEKNSFTTISEKSPTVLNDLPSNLDDFVPSHHESSISTSDFIPSNLSFDDMLPSQLFALLVDNGTPKLLFSCGHWDNSCKVISPDTGKIIQSTNKHLDVVTCIALSSDSGNHWLVSGSKDCTVILWDILLDKESPLSMKTKLYGHDGAIRSVAINAELDTIISGSDDGTLLVYSLREGTYIRCIDLKNLSSSSPISLINKTETSRSVGWVGLSKEFIITAWVVETQELCSFSINGHHLASSFVDDYLYSYCYSDDGTVLVTGGKRGLLVMRWVRNLQLANTGIKKGMMAIVDGSRGEKYDDYFNSPIRSICFSKEEQHIIVGLESGKIRILSQDSRYLRPKLREKLTDLGF